MITQGDEETRSRAYDLWEKEGRPAGKDKDHWAQAERELARPAEQDNGDEPVGGTNQKSEGEGEPSAPAEGEPIAIVPDVRWCDGAARKRPRASAVDENARLEKRGYTRFLKPARRSDCRTILERIISGSQSIRSPLGAPRFDYSRPERRNPVAP